MTNVERTGRRSLAYSAWHRTLTSAGRPELGFLDIDWIEFCSADGCKRRLAIMELAFDDGRQDGKYAGQTEKLARDSNTPGYLVLYHTDTGGQLDAVRARCLWPTPQADFTTYTPQRWATVLFGLRTCHPLRTAAQAAQQEAPHSHSWLAKDRYGLNVCSVCDEIYVPPKLTVAS